MQYCLVENNIEGFLLLSFSVPCQTPPRDMSPGVVSDQRLALLSERAKEMVTEINLVADYCGNLLESARVCIVTFSIEDFLGTINIFPSKGYLLSGSWLF